MSHRKSIIERAKKELVKARFCEVVGFGASGTFYPYSGPAGPPQPLFMTHCPGPKTPRAQKAVTFIFPKKI